jgi:hypothetical protein
MRGAKYSFVREDATKTLLFLQRIQPICGICPKKGRQHEVVGLFLNTQNDHLCPTNCGNDLLRCIGKTFGVGDREATGG